MKKDNLKNSLKSAVDVSQVTGLKQTGKTGSGNFLMSGCSL